MFDKQKKKFRQPVKFHDFWEIDDQKVNTSYHKLWRRIEQLPPLIQLKPAFNWWKPVAIALFFIVLIISGLYRNSTTHPIQQPVEIEYITDKSTQFDLSDGTKVWLSAHSQLRFQQTFTGGTRDVALDGEAYFEVAHNREQPFRVLTGDQTVVALGTCFNVRTYTAEPEVKITLMEGSIRVTDDKSGHSIVLKPAQEATIIKSTGSIVVNDVDLNMAMSWKTGIYVFNNITFEEIITTLEKGFHVTIQIENEALKNKPYTMRFENGESLEKILELIQINANYSYQYINGNIIIK